MFWSFIRFTLQLGDIVKKLFLLQIPENEVKRYMIDCMTSVGTAEENAAHLADALVAGDKRGHFSHGLNRLGN